MLIQKLFNKIIYLLINNILETRLLESIIQNTYSNSLEIDFST